MRIRMRSAALAAATLAGATCVVAPSVGAAPAVAAAPAAVTAISVTSPATGNTWVHGQKVNITWSATGAATADKVKIDLYKGTTKVVAISASTGAAAGTFEYTIPTTLEAGNDYKVTISSIATSPVSDDSDTFSVAKPGLTSVTTPGASWVLGKKYEVVWDALGDPGNVAVTLTKAGGTPVTISVSGGAKATDEKLSYTVPVTLPTGSYTLKVASVNPSSTVTPVVSNAFNVVAPVVAVSTPDNAQAVPLGG
ncbi:MAG: Ser-Thr-rich GPI-anchored membrane family protein, partial [Acidimicrobiales bacterium]